MTMEHRLVGAFGEAPPEFEAAMLRSIERARATPRRPRMRAVLIAAAIMLLLAGTAYAVARGTGILDFLKRQLGITATAGRMVQTGIAQRGGALRGATFRLDQAIADGKLLYFTLRAAPNDGDILLEEMQSATEMVDTGEDMSYAELSYAEGKRLVRASLLEVSVNGEAYTEYQPISTARDGGDLVYACYAVAEVPTGEPIRLRLRLGAAPVYGDHALEHGALDAEIAPHDRPATLRWTKPVTLDALGIELTSVRVTDTPIIRLGEIRYRVLPTDDEAQLATAHSARLTLCPDDSDEQLHGSLGEAQGGGYAVYEMLPPVQQAGQVVVAINARGEDTVRVTLPIEDAQREDGV